MTKRTESEPRDPVPTPVDSGELGDVTRLMLMGEIRMVRRADSKAVLHPPGYRLAFGDARYPDAVTTVYPEGSTEPLYHLYANDPTSAVEFFVSEGRNPSRRVPLNEKGGQWFRRLIADGIQQISGPWRS